MQVESPQRLAALTISASIADRLKTPQMMREAATGLAQVADMHGLNGAAAVAMLHSALSTLHRGDDRDSLAHDFLSFASSRPEFDDMGVFTGWIGIGLAARFIAASSGRYAKLQSAVRDAYAAGVLGDLGSGDFTLQSSHEYEFVQGYAGGYVLLDANENRDAVNAIVEFFDWLTAEASGARWKLRNIFDRTHIEPINVLGVSHGIAGVLAALTCRATTDQEFEIIERLGMLLCNSAHWGRYGPQWGYSLDDKAEIPDRVAWCHGSLGIAATLLNAGHLLGIAKFCDYAVSSALGIADLPLESWGMRDFSLCHGVAGNAVLLYRLGTAAREPRLLELAAVLTSQIIDGFDESLSLGYVSYYLNEQFTDPGFLIGSVGIALALLTLTDHIEDSWLEILGIGRVAASADEDTASALK